MNARQLRLSETFDAIGGPLSRLGESLQQDREAVTKIEAVKSGYDLLATDAFLQRFQQVTDLALRKLFPRILAVLDASDVRYPFGAVLDRLDGYEVLSDVPWWIELNAVRNRLVHEYAMEPEQRAVAMREAFDAGVRLRDELMRMRSDASLAEKLRA